MGQELNDDVKSIVFIPKDSQTGNYAICAYVIDNQALYTKGYFNNRCQNLMNTYQYIKVQSYTKATKLTFTTISSGDLGFVTDIKFIQRNIIINCHFYSKSNWIDFFPFRLLEKLIHNTTEY